jgi:hypothetical protein
MSLRTFLAHVDSIRERKARGSSKALSMVLPAMPCTEKRAGDA